MYTKQKEVMLDLQCIGKTTVLKNLQTYWNFRSCVEDDKRI